MNKYYVRSYRAERRAFRELESEGYSLIRASSSKGVCDLVAISGTKVRLIEVKVPDRESNIRWRIDEHPLKSIKTPDNVSKEVWYWIVRKGWRKVIF